MDIEQVLKKGIELGASDIFLVAGAPIVYKVGAGDQIRESEKLMPDETRMLAQQLYTLAHRDPFCLTGSNSDDDFAVSLFGIGRFRVNLFRQRGSIAAVVRVIKFGIPTAKELGVPAEVMRVSNYKKGIVLVTGPAGSGKTSTLSCIIDQINHTRNGHILTLEDPIEFIHKHDKCLVSQREIQIDCPTYVDALHSALRESPDVILLGEMRDRETMEVAMTAAETGQLVLSSLHTLGAANTIDRIVDAFPANQQQQIRLQLSMVLQAVISQQLLPGINGDRVPVFEIMYTNIAIRNHIRESKTHQIESVIASSGAQGMRTMDMSILKLYQENKITKETALTYCLNYETMSKRIGN